MPLSALHCLSLSLIAACVGMLAVLGTFIPLFIGFFDPPCLVLLVVPFCCNYPALMRSVPLILLVRSLLSSHFGLSPSLLIHCL